MKVKLKDGLSRMYGRLKTPEGIRQTFIEPSTAYEVTDDYASVSQSIRVPIGDEELRDELNAVGIAFEKTTSAPPCCKNKGVDIYTFQPLEEVDTSLYEEVVG